VIPSPSERPEPTGPAREYAKRGVFVCPITSSDPTLSTPSSIRTSLPELVEQIAAAHQSARDAYQHAAEHASTAVHHAVTAGQLLLAVQAQVQTHGGDWLPWVRQNCAFSARTAQRYMRLAGNWSAWDEQKRHAVSRLSLRRALRMAAPAETKRKAVDPLQQKRLDLHEHQVDYVREFLEREGIQVSKRAEDVERKALVWLFDYLQRRALAA
jgi:hypothetical protein